MIPALRVNAEIKFFQTLKLRAGGFISDPLVLHSNFLIPSYNDRNLWVSLKIFTFSGRAERIEDDLQLVSDGNSDYRRLRITTRGGGRHHAKTVLLKES